LTPGTPVKVEELASTHCKKYINQFIEGTMPQVRYYFIYK